MRTPAGLPMTGGIGAAVEEARHVRVQAQAERSKRTGIQRLITRTDAMIEELELENLRGIHLVSAAWWPRLAVLLSSLPFDVRLPIRAPRTPVELLDLVYEVQEKLFALKNGRQFPFRPCIDDPDEWPAHCSDTRLRR
jgi:hypothetical protein